MTHLNPKVIASITTAIAATLLCAAATAQEGAETYWDGTKDTAGQCKPAVKEAIKKKVTPTPEVLAKGKAKYAVVCAACHGEAGLGNGPAAAALNPKPRNFSKEKFVKGSDVLSLYDVVTNGLPGTAMAGFEAAANEEERWGIAHYVQSLMPKEKLETITEVKIEEICAKESATRLDPIPVNLAMEIILEETASRRANRMKGYGPVKLNDKADATHGKAVWGQACASCHGQGAEGVENLGHYGRFPFIQVYSRSLLRDAAGGTWATFADRVDGYHSTLPNMTSSAQLDDSDWMGLQSYFSKLNGTAEVTSDAPPAPATNVGLISVSEAYELHYRAGKVVQLTYATTEGQPATIAPVSDYAAFKSLFKALTPPEGEKADVLPEELPEGGPELTIIAGLPCLTAANGCGADALKADNLTRTKIKISFE